TLLVHKTGFLGRLRLESTLSVIQGPVPHYPVASSLVPSAPVLRSNDMVTTMKVSEILQVKGDILYTVSPDTPLADAVTTMSERDIGSLVVMEFGELVGMLTFREVIHALNEHGSVTAAGTVRRHMDDSPITVTPGT